MPRTGTKARLEEQSKGRPKWRFSQHDRGGPFAWPPPAEDVPDILSRFVDFESQSFNDLYKGAGCHEIEVAQLSKEARARLEALCRDDLDCVYSLRITGRRRVFAIREGDTLHVLWFDPLHQVCPSLKD